VRPSPAISPLARALFAGALLALAGCGGASARARALAPHEGRAAELFDDVIEPRAVGLDIEEKLTPRTDPTLRERTQLGDAVVRVRVDNVTATGAGANVRWSIGLRVLEKLAGAHPPPDTFVVTLDRSSPSAGILGSLQGRISGRTFVAFVKEFAAGEDGAFHFHMAPDTKDVRQAVEEAVALGEFK
jgi:hypothetical protein